MLGYTDWGPFGSTWGDLGVGGGSRYGGNTTLEYPGIQTPRSTTAAPILGGIGGGAGGVGGGGMNSAQIAELTRMVNEINQASQKAANDARIPGGPALESQSSANIGSALRGEVDPSTRYLLGQAAAERGVASGSPMGPGGDVDYLRALGLTSYDRMNTGQGWLTGALARNPAAPIYDAGNQVTTAAQQLQAQLAREQMAARNSGRGGGGGGGTATRPNVSTSASNWQPLFGQDKPVPTPTPWTPQPNPAFYNDFQSQGGTYGGMNLGPPDYPITPGVPVPPYQMPFSTNWEDVIFNNPELSTVNFMKQVDSQVRDIQDYSDLEDFIYRDSGG